MSLSFGEINIWAVIVSAVATFMVGGLWYAALFGNAWAKANAFSEDELKAMAAKQGRSFGIFFVADLVMATVISLFVINLEIASFGQGAVLGFLLWLGLAATIGGAKKAAYNKPLAVYLIDTSHELACLLVMGAILGGWR